MKFNRPVAAPGFVPSHIANTGNGVIESWVALGNSGNFYSLITGKGSITSSGTPTKTHNIFGSAVNTVSGDCSYTSKGTGLSISQCTMAAIAAIKVNTTGCILLSTVTLAVGGCWTLRCDNLVLHAYNNGVNVSSGITLQIGVPYFLGASWGGSFTNNLNFIAVNLLTGQILTNTTTVGTTPFILSDFALGGQSTTFGNADISALMFSNVAIGLESFLKWAEDDPFNFWYPESRNPNFFGQVGHGLTVNNVALTLTEPADTFAAVVSYPATVSLALTEPPDSVLVNISQLINVTVSVSESPDAVAALINNPLGITGGSQVNFYRRQLTPPLTRPGYNLSHIVNSNYHLQTQTKHGVIDSWVALGNSNQFYSVITGKSTTTNSGSTSLKHTQVGAGIDCSTGSVRSTNRVGSYTLVECTLAAIIIPTVATSGVIVDILYSSGQGPQLRIDSLQFGAFNNHNQSSGIFLEENVPYFLAASFFNEINFIAVNLLTGQIFTATANSLLTAGTITSYGLGGDTFGLSGCSTIITGMISENSIGPQKLYEWAQDFWSFWYPTTTFDVLRNVAGLPGPLTVQPFFVEPSDSVSGLISYHPTVVPQIGTFPPDGPTTQTKVLPSYLYEEYSDDDDLQNFVASYNSIAQEFIDTLNALNLPIYTGLFNSLLDWVGSGLYGYPRPALFSFMSQTVGPLNTWELNSLMLNFSKLIGESNVLVTTDDFYKRLLTWYLYKADGRYFTVRWLKRRIMRFLIGIDGSTPNIDQTYQISITFGSNNVVAIRFIDYETVTVGSAQLNVFELNGINSQLNFWQISNEQLVPLPNRDTFKDAVTSGAIELPFQYTWDVQL